MAGYNIVCDPGDLYTRKCYVLNPTTGEREEIIGYTAGGDPISKAPTTAAGTAWQPTVTTLDLSGNAYQPYGQAGLPFTMAGGISGVGAIMPSSGSDPQDWKYLETMPGANARRTYQQRTCNPLWPTLGCRQGPLGSVDLPSTDNGSSMPESEGFFSRIKSLFGSETNTDSSSDDAGTVAGEDPAVQDTTSQPQEPAADSGERSGLTPAGRVIVPALVVGVVGIGLVGAYLNYKMFTYDPGLYVAGKSVGALGLLARDAEEE